VPVPLPSPIPADVFDFPLDPTRFGPYVQGVTGPLNVDTRFGVQNPGLGSAGKCCRSNGDVPFDKLYAGGLVAPDAQGECRGWADTGHGRRARSRVDTADRRRATSS
jgi:hypothetical protein